MNIDRSFAFRELVASVLILYFGYMLIMNINDAELKGALITAFAASWGFYLGGSKTGSDTAARNAETVTKKAEEPAPVIGNADTVNVNKENNNG